MRFVLPTFRRSRHPLVRALSMLVGLALVAVLLVFGLLVTGVLLTVGAVLLARRQWKLRHVMGGSAAAAGAHRPAVLEGEFVVLGQDHPVAH
jgi:hypothetical protein